MCGENFSNVFLLLFVVLWAPIFAAPAGGAAAAAPDGDALAGPSALTPTSSWWALGTQAWYGRGLGGVFRQMRSTGEKAIYGGLLK
jgi:hypothetical protein